MNGSETGKVAEGDKKKTRDRHRTLENMLKASCPPSV